MISATLTFPANVAAKVPAMVLAHGSGGVQKKDLVRWVPFFRDHGVATFVVDSYTPRGITRTVEDQSQVDPAAHTADALFALKVLAAHPMIDRDRIGMIGFSRGGGATIEANIDAFRRGVIDDDLRFALHVAFYPSCAYRFWGERNHATKAPLLMLLGERDDYTPANFCVSYAERMKLHGHDVSVIVYPGAHHNFDGLNNTHQWLAGATTPRNCPIREVNIDTWEYTIVKTGQKFKTYKEMAAAAGDCITRGVTASANERTAKQAERDLLAFLRRHGFLPDSKPR